MNRKREKLFVFRHIGGKNRRQKKSGFCYKNKNECRKKMSKTNKKHFQISCLKSL